MADTGAITKSYTFEIIPDDLEMLAMAERLQHGLTGHVMFKHRTYPDDHFEKFSFDFRLWLPYQKYPESREEILVAKFSIHRNRKTLYLDTLRIPEHCQQRGVGKTFVRNLFEEMIAMGIEEISMRTEKIGSYFWLRCGGQPEGHVSLWTLRCKDMTEAIAKRLQELKAAGDYAAIADLRDETTNYGFLLTNDSEWSGKIDLKDPAVLSRLQQYLGLRFAHEPAARRMTKGRLLINEGVG